MPRLRALASPASLKGSLDAVAAAAALAEGFRRSGVDAVELPVADGGEGTAEVLATAVGGEWRTAAVSDPLGRAVRARYLLLPGRMAVVESAEAIGLGRLRPEERDPLRASSRGLGELIRVALGERLSSLLVCLGGSATVDGGAGLREVLDSLPVETTVACDVRNPLLGERGAARVFGPQKGATPAAVEELEAKLAGMDELRRVADLPGAGAAGGLGAALAALGAELVPGADLVLDLVGFHERLRGASLVVTGEGTVDRTSAEGKAPGAVARACAEAGVRCVVFGGRVEEPLPGAQHEELSGDPARAREDLVALGGRLGLALEGTERPPRT
jgi:glycerate 2-kinase